MNFVPPTIVFRGKVFQPVRKCMGLKPGEAIERLGPPVRALICQREPLDILVRRPDYGYRELAREGFPDWTPERFVEMFCDTHRGCELKTEVTRIEFSYDLLEGWNGMHTAPKDGSTITLLVRHLNWLYARGAEKDSWQEAVRAEWTDFNGGGWTWRGICGEPIAWRQ